MAHGQNKYYNPYGECCLCHYVGTLKYHHIIPKSMRVMTDMKPKLFYEITTNTITKIDLPKLARIENIVIHICENCHDKLHREYKKYKLVPFSIFQMKEDIIIAKSDKSADLPSPETADMKSTDFNSQPKVEISASPARSI